MTHIAQDLHAIFPEDAALLRRLKAEDRHFQALAARFDTLDSNVHHIESEAEAASDIRLESLKKQRLAVLDEIAATLAHARAA